MSMGWFWSANPHYTGNEPIFGQPRSESVLDFEGSDQRVKLML